MRPSFVLSKAPSGSGQFNVLLRILLFVLFAQAATPAVNAQTSPVEARVATVSGSTIRSSTLSPSQSVQRGDLLAPGDEIDTRGGGHVVIELSDGSVIIVQPGSRILFQDYRAAGSLSELFTIMVGRVRVKINHFGGRSNPYRVNSPTASIAVRGTDFSVAVQESGATEVIVYAGLVEVTSLNDPSQTIPVGPGRSVIVRPNADVLYFMPGREEDGRDRFWDGNWDTTDAAVFYEQYGDRLTETAETPVWSRFVAFPDPYIEGIDNPAYATEFSTVEGRLLLLPSLSGAQSEDTKGASFGSISAVPLNYTVSPQGSFFLPLPRFQSVVGGTFVASRGQLQSLSVDGQDVAPESPLGVTAVSGSTKNNYLTGSLIAAHAFGSSKRTSLGLGFAQTWKHGSHLNAMAQTDQASLTPREQFAASSFIRRPEIDVGLTHIFSGGHKLGVVYRYGILSANELDRLSTPNTEPIVLDSIQERVSSSEFGVRLRGPITRRLFYGLEVALLFTDQDEKLQLAKGVDVSGPERTKRSVASVGLGYAPSRRILLAFDIASGSSWTRDRHYENATGNLLDDNRDHMHFLSTHTALQADIWRRMFASASILSVTQTSQSHLLTGRVERLLTSVGQSVPNGDSRKHFTYYSSDFGIGWRFSPSFLAQYIFSTDYALTSPRHTLLLRYSFRLGRE